VDLGANASVTGVSQPELGQPLVNDGNITMDGANDILAEGPGTGFGCALTNDAGATINKKGRHQYPGRRPRRLPHQGGHHRRRHGHPGLGQQHRPGRHDAPDRHLHRRLRRHPRALRRRPIDLEPGSSVASGPSGTGAAPGMATSDDCGSATDTLAGTRPP
jgi:hypothetical protein